MRRVKMVIGLTLYFGCMVIMYPLAVVPSTWLPLLGLFVVATVSFLWLVSHDRRVSISRRHPTASVPTSVGWIDQIKEIWKDRTPTQNN